MFFNLNWKKGFVFFLLMGFMQMVSASIVLNTAQILFVGDEQEKTINIMNADATPTLVQSWIEQSGKKTQNFLATPPLFRLEGNMNSDLRVVKMNQNLPQDRDSLYFLNVKGIPPMDPGSKNDLMIAINSRIKMIYRPEALNNSNADEAYKKLTFSLKDKKLIVKNPTPYYVPINGLTLGDESINTIGYSLPFSENAYPIKKPITKYQVSWSSGKGEAQTKPVR